MGENDPQLNKLAKYTSNHSNNRYNNHGGEGKDHRKGKKEHSKQHHKQKKHHNERHERSQKPLHKRTGSAQEEVVRDPAYKGELKEDLEKNPNEKDNNVVIDNLIESSGS